MVLYRTVGHRFDLLWYTWFDFRSVFGCFVYILHHAITRSTSSSYCFYSALAISGLCSQYIHSVRKSLVLSSKHTFYLLLNPTHIYHCQWLQLRFSCNSSRCFLDSIFEQSIKTNISENFKQNKDLNFSPPLKIAMTFWYMSDILVSDGATYQTHDVIFYWWPKTESYKFPHNFDPFTRHESLFCKRVLDHLGIYQF